jgi:hypothetical protein
LQVQQKALRSLFCGGLHLMKRVVVLIIPPVIFPVFLLLNAKLILILLVLAEFHADAPEEQFCIHDQIPGKENQEIRNGKQQCNSVAPR